LIRQGDSPRILFEPLKSTPVLTSHNAPSVTYPLEHSRFHGYLLLCLWLMGFLLTLLWLYGNHAFDWRAYPALAAVMLAGAVAYKGWKSAPVGQLIWDGQCWRWEGTGYLTDVTEQKLAVIVDFQTLLLLRLENPAYAYLWLWAERRVQPERWLDLRRAVYAPHRSVKPVLRNSLQIQEPLQAVALSSPHLPVDTSPKS
jgi:hypothetical protein